IFPVPQARRARSPRRSGARDGPGAPPSAGGARRSKSKRETRTMLLRSLTAAMLLVPALALADPPPGKGRNKGAAESEASAPNLAGAAAAAAFSALEVQRIRAYYASPAAPAPQSLPPGIAKNLARGKPLPPGIAK